MFSGFSRWYERAVLFVLVLVNSFTPMSVNIRLNRWFACFMARNPKHAFSRRMVELLGEAE